MHIFLKKELSSPDSRETMEGQLLEYGFSETIEAEIGRTAEELAQNLAEFPENARVAIWFPGAGVHPQETNQKVRGAIEAPQEVAFVTFEEIVPNALGRQISRGVIGRSEACIVLLQEDGTKAEVGYSDEGYLTGYDWPYGWFAGSFLK